MSAISAMSRFSIRRMRTALVVGLAAMPLGMIGAQSSMLIGSVTTDSAHKHGIEGAEISIASLHRSVRTNAPLISMASAML